MTADEVSIVLIGIGVGGALLFWVIDQRRELLKREDRHDDR